MKTNEIYRELIKEKIKKIDDVYTLHLINKFIEGIQKEG